MKNDLEKNLALARKDGLVIRELQDEVLVYDVDRDKAHCLNRSAAAVWKRADGMSTPKTIAHALQKEFGTVIDEKFIWLALDQLSRHHLLDSSVDWPQNISRFSRREAIRRLGLGAAIALPLVVSMTAPSPAQAATCRGPGSVCNTPSQCCSSICACPPAQTCPPSNTRCV